MACSTIVADTGVSPCQFIIVPVYGKSGRFPTWIGRMAIITCVGNTDSHVVRILRLDVIIIMAISANSGCPRVPAFMAIVAGHTQMSACQWKIGAVMVEAPCLSGRMAFIACLAVPDISTDSFMLDIHICLVMRVAIDATKNGIISRIGMAVGTGIPFPLVFP